MRTVFYVLLLVLIGAGVYAYVKDPDDCAKLANDVKADLAKVFSPATATSPAASASSSSAVASGSSTSSAAAPVATPPPKPPWAPPAVIPAQPNWTWKTPQGTYTNVRIVKIDADCVTILDDDGGALVPIANLPPDVQKLLNYDSDAALAAANQRAQIDATSSQAMIAERANPGAGSSEAFDGGMTDYPSAVEEAKTSGKRMLIIFTGSDWNNYSQALSSEVLATPLFQQFVAQHFIFVTLDFPKTASGPNDPKSPNDEVADKFSVNLFPTLMVVDGNEKEIGRHSGYDPGLGPQGVINELKPWTQ